MLSVRLLAGIEGLLFGVSMFFFVLDGNGGPEGLRSRQIYHRESQRYHSVTEDPSERFFSEYPGMIGHLEVEGTRIDYPVMRDRTDSNGSYFYLTHNFRGETDHAGCPFIRRSASLDDDIIEIFAHNNSNGTMFADLSLFENEDFFMEHGDISFDTEEGQRTYEVISVLDVDVPSEVFSFFGWSNFDGESRELEFLRQISEAAVVENCDGYETGNQYLLLVTCEYSHVNGRRVVVAVRTS